MIHPFAIVGRQRSGTTFLRKALSMHPDVVCHGEIFGAERVRGINNRLRAAVAPLGQRRDTDPVGFLDAFLALHDHGHVGFKLMLRQNETIFTEIIRRGWPLIVVQRKNLLARYSSVMIARGTGQRVAKRGVEVKRLQLQFNCGEFENFRKNENRLWETQIEKPGIYNNALMIDYCEFVTSDGLRRVFEYVGVEAIDAAPNLQKQNSSDIVSRFTNPDDVIAHLEAIGHPEWRLEELQT